MKTSSALEPAFPLQPTVFRLSVGRTGHLDPVLIISHRFTRRTKWKAAKVKQRWRGDKRHRLEAGLLKSDWHKNLSLTCELFELWDYLGFVFFLMKPFYLFSSGLYFWLSLEPDGCSNKWKFFKDSRMTQVTSFPVAKSEFDCRRGCVKTSNCNGVDWNSVTGECYLTDPTSAYIELGTATGWNHFTLLRSAECGMLPWKFNFDKQDTPPYSAGFSDPCAATQTLNLGHAHHNCDDRTI